MLLMPIWQHHLLYKQFRCSTQLEGNASTSSSNIHHAHGGWQQLVETKDGATSFNVDNEGRVVVPEDGMYLVYAQVVRSAKEL